MIAAFSTHLQITITFSIYVIFEELKDHATRNGTDFLFNYS